MSTSAHLESLADSLWADIALSQLEVEDVGLSLLIHTFRLERLEALHQLALLRVCDLGAIREGYDVYVRHG